MDEITKSCCQQNREQCEKLMDVKFNALQNLFETKVIATEKATQLAADVLKIRLEGLNELRQMASDKDINFVTKAEFNAQVINIEQLRLSEAKLAGKADYSAVEKVDKRADAANTRGNISIIIAIIVFIFSVVIHFIK